MRRSWSIAALAFVMGCGGASTPGAGTPLAEAAPVECTVALRVDAVSDGVLAEDASADDAPPSSQLFLIRICDGERRQATPLGLVHGVCDVGGDTDALHLSCWWRGRTTRVVLDRDGASLVATELGVDGPRTLGRAPLPENARVHYLEGPRSR